MRFLFSLFAGVVLATEGALSPLADDALVAPPQAPTITFGQLTTSFVPAGEVLGAATEPQPTPIPTPTPRPTRKKTFTIAILGDSMIDTLGPDVPALKSKLSSLYPGINFQLLNYGVGGTNIDYGIERLTGNYTYLGEQKPPLVSQKPDIVVIESFGYNPYSFDEGALDKHWLAMAKIVDTLRANIPGVKIIVAATIAPDAKTFGDGAAGVSFSAEDKWKRVDVIKKYLDNAVRFAKSQGLPLADAFHPSLGSDGNGKETYINQGDHIHYSDAGRNLMAQKITDAITANRLLE
ncbi:SGNH/GDSL hydrolase family protein [Candidatus Gottesmanbacteria bacterium]|nr:SGNH/GDSL hydrolase family protein [Candidatus Gottesmanbacteria bacterium]